MVQAVKKFRRFDGKRFKLTASSKTRKAAEGRAVRTYHTNRYRIIKGLTQRGVVWRIYVGPRRKAKKGCITRRL